jgi:hypothetical protein
MSDTDTPRDETTGQFTPNTDGLFGREAEEAAAGYKPMPAPRDPEWKGFESAEDAADALSASRNEDQTPVEVSYLKVETGEKADGHETVTVERAAADLAAYRADRIQSAAQSISADFAAEIDRMRGEAIKANPEELGKHYGVDPALAAEAHEPENVKAADPVEAATSDAVDEMDGLDPETRKALKIPQVRQALEQEFAKADQARTHLESTIHAGQQMLQATVAALAPQLDGMPIEHWPQAIQMLSQVDPVRGQLVADTLQRWSAMQQADQQIKAQAAHEQAQEFRAFKAAEDAKLAESLGGDRGLVQQYAPKVQSYFKSLGMTEAEMWALRSHGQQCAGATGVARCAALSGNHGGAEGCPNAGDPCRAAPGDQIANQKQRQFDQAARARGPIRICRRT